MKRFRGNNSEGSGGFWGRFHPFRFLMFPGGTDRWRNVGQTSVLSAPFVSSDTDRFGV